MKARIKSVIAAGGPSSFAKVGAEFEVVGRPGDIGFNILVPYGNGFESTMFCQWEGCSHLGGGRWEVVEDAD
jgi:hypothetical protein